MGEKGNEQTNTLNPKKIGLWSMTFMTIAAIYPMAMAVSNASAAVSYGGFAAPLIPIIGAIVILFVTAPVMEYARIASFAGGYYGLAELGFGISAGKFVGLFRLFYDLFFDTLTATAFAYIIYTTFYVLYNYSMPGIALIGLAIFFMILLYVFTIVKLEHAALINNIIQIIQIAILIIFSIIVIARTPFNSLAAFNPASAPSGVSGLMLGVILAGFLFYTGYGTPLYLSEEGKEPFRNVWRAIVLGVLITSIVGTVTIYAEVVGIGPSKLSVITSVLNPGISAYLPYVGIVGIGAFVIAAWLGQLMGGVSPGLGTVRDIYALARDNFFGERGRAYFTKMNKSNVPSNAALLNLILGILTTGVIEALMIFYYGLPEGAFYALFLSGSMVVAYWFILHFIADFSLTALYRKYKFPLFSLRNFFIGIISPIGAAIIFIYSFYMGYSSLPEPYFGGLIFVFISAIVGALIIAVSRHRGAKWESYISKTVQIKQDKK